MNRQILALVAVVFTLFAGVAHAAEPPARTVLVIVDGLHFKAPERLSLPVFNQLARTGSVVDKVTGIIPYHPTHGEYARVHTSSYPNPMMMAGTLFLSAKQRMLQHEFGDAAFIANSRSYQSITDGYEVVIQQVGTDAVAVGRAIEVLRDFAPDFLRLHLQNTGNGGSETLEAADDAPWKHDIWHPDSPYVAKAAEADRQVGRLVAALQDMGQWDDTLFIVTSDHGQTTTGWHPTLPEESWMFPAVFHGPGIRAGHRIEWADQTDFVPTIAHLAGVPAPNEDGGAGRVLTPILAGSDDQSDGLSLIYPLNQVLARYIVAEAELILASREAPYLNSLAMSMESRFYGLRRVMNWHEMGSVEALTEHDREVVLAMEGALAQWREAQTGATAP
ncbi:sulfatase-like hydrolase/transferase [Marinihelvus fidelis]|nr:sulfatase-like hydrolase/transferase [Marinihelvus fidelis]